MADLEIAFRLPTPSWPRAVFESDYGYRGGRLTVDGERLLEATTREALLEGVEGTLGAEPVAMRLFESDGAPTVRVRVGDREAPREKQLRAPPSRSAWKHAAIALAGSFAGFVASYLYLRKADALGSAWALKMGNHMAAWHLLLTFTLFPASVWGQRLGIRSVQAVSLVFFLIHAGIAVANVVGPDNPGDPNDPLIATLNAVSGLLFLAATIYGNRAHRDMDPIAYLKRASGASAKPAR